MDILEMSTKWFLVFTITPNVICFAIVMVRCGKPRDLLGISFRQSSDADVSNAHFVADYSKF